MTSAMSRTARLNPGATGAADTTATKKLNKIKMLLWKEMLKKPTGSGEEEGGENFELHGV